MQVNIGTKYNIGDTVYQLVGTDIYERTIKSILTLSTEKGIDVRYIYEGLFNSVNEKELYSSVGDIMSSIKLVDKKE